MVPWLVPVMGFVKGNWKVLGVVAIAAFVWWQGKGLFNDWVAREQAEDEAKMILISERHDARVEAESSKAALAEVRKQLEFVDQLRKEAIAEQDVVRERAREQQEIFERHNLRKLSEAKPGLIEKLANKATQERMDDFEDAFNQ